MILWLMVTVAMSSRIAIGMSKVDDVLITWDLEGYFGAGMQGLFSMAGFIW